MFKTPHLLFLLFTLFTVPYLASKAKTLSNERFHKLMKVTTFFVLSLDPLYWVWEWHTYQHFNWSKTLPLYLCSLFWLLLPLAVFGKSAKLRHMARASISSAVLFAGVFGLVFNTHLNAHDFLSFVPMRSLIYHYLMILVSVSFWSTGYHSPGPRDTLISLVPVYVLLVPCLVLSYRFGWDYAFTAGGPGTPLEVLSSQMPLPLFLLTLYGTASVVIHLFVTAMRHHCTAKSKIAARDIASAN